MEQLVTDEQILHQDTARKIFFVLDDLLNDLKAESKTGALWICYLSISQLMRLFIYAERIGDFELHLHCVEKMIPFFHASNHFKYAKSTRRYLDTMRELGKFMPADQYAEYTQSGYFTIRRSDRFWSGNFTDQTIEQYLMKNLKAPGGCAHGRGLAESTQAKFVHAMPKCVPICNALEDFCGVQTYSSDQHRDLRASTEKKDGEHASVFYSWLIEHSPFIYKDLDGLVDLSTGIVADKSSNAHLAYEIGLKAAHSITGMTFSDVKLKRADGVISIKAARDKINVRGQEVEYNCELLFARVSSVSTPQEMQENLKYEFARAAPSLFEKGLMRKNDKSVLGHLLRDGYALDVQAPTPGEQHVVDGGKFVQTVPWPPTSENYEDVLNEYIRYACNNYSPHSHFVMDGYEDENSVKIAEQKRRIKGNVARDIIFKSDTKLSKFTKSEFLNNILNKGRFVKLLSQKLRQNGYEVTECKRDADIEIAQAALSQSKHGPICLDANDTDILVMVVHAGSVSADLIMKLPSDRYRITDIKQGLKPNAVKYALVAHGMSGNDTVSALFRRGKCIAFKVIDKGTVNDLSYLDTFLSKTSSHDEVAFAGEKFLLAMYNSPKKVKTLDDLRFEFYKKRIKKTLTSKTGVELRSLPPTSDSAKYHSYRAYYQIQLWLGNKQIDPTDWGWVRNGYLVPIVKDREAAPDKVLRLISCGCKQGCSVGSASKKSKCSCVNAGLKCTILCSGCNGRDCDNCDHFIESEETV